MKTADTFAVCQSEGKTDMSNDSWKMSGSAGTRVSAQVFKTTLGIWSGQHTLWELMDLSNLHTSAVVINITCWVLWKVNVWRGRSTISGEDTVDMVQEDLGLLLAVTHQ